MLKSKRITANIPEYIKSVVALEDRILFAKSAPIQIPKDMKYPKSYMTPTSMYVFLKGCLP